ncbi:MBG domain-containing protein [Burkholderia thailandensis]|uniref:MBG domain-containing protein n=1 Tax=Burkholderia thailandensis TaxID=57975 RepID=UPI002D798A22|nr:MBG domain-containing protein [Burkholderia thailandensis]WRS69955.1 MBG domain-containing protein [Burkholderia thailandensis]
MNKNTYRLVFNRKRGMLMAVEENAAAQTKGDATGQCGARATGVGAPLWLAPLNGLRLAAALLIGVTVPLGAVAGGLPQGGSVVGGAANIQTPNPNQMIITQGSQQAAINWNSFNVGAGNSVQFVQPSSTASVLNRVVGMNGASQILGTLTANGQVYIVNPQGVVFGKGAVVNAGALLATTKNIDPNAFMANGSAQLLLGGRGTSGGVIENYGNLSVAPGGWIALAGDRVRNTGALNAPHGSVVLAAGDQATLALANGQLVCFTLDAASANAAIASDGVIDAKGGHVLLTANAAGMLLNNVINLSGVVDVSGATGGNVTIEGGLQGVVNLGGAQINASGATGTGGNVMVTGADIGLSGTAINATGASGGGTVLVGGNLHGGGNVPHATTVTMDKTSTIDASATRNGNGGTVVLWSDSLTTFNGAVVARGGQLGGNGGMVETSSKNLLMFNPVSTVDTRAPHGAWGTLLLDPLNIQITHGPAGGNTVSQVNAASATINMTITDGEIAAELLTGNVQLSATNSVADDATVSVASVGAGSLSLTGYQINLAGSYNVAGGLALNASSLGSTITGSIGGSGGLTVAGGGTFTTVGSGNTYTGTTTIGGGTSLVVGSGATTGSLGTGAIVDNGNLKINMSGAFQVASAISGTGGIAQIGTGTTSLSGANTYSGTTVISAGTLQVNTGGSLGTGTVTDNGRLVFNQSGNTTVAGAVTGTGNIVQQGAGTTTFAQNLSITSVNETAGGLLFGGNVTVGQCITSTGGMLQVGNGGSTAITFDAAVNTSGDLTFNSAGPITVNQAITAGGNVTFSGAGATTLNGNVNASSGVVFNSTGTTTVNGVISGSAMLTQSGTGTAVLNANNTYSGATNINSGATLQVGSNGATGSLGTGAVTDNGNLVVNTSGSQNISAISGSGNVTKQGSGTLFVSGANTYTGTTTISGGSLQLQPGARLATSQIIDNANLIFNQTSPTTFGTNISGVGSVVQAGSGNLTLTGNNTYTGGTTVNAGDWLIAGSATALPNGYLGVNGGLDMNGFNVSATTLAGGGTILDNGGNATLTLTGGSYAPYFSGVIKDGTGAVSLHMKSAVNYQQFAGANTYSGGTTIDSGATVQINGYGQLGSGAIVDNGLLNFWTGAFPLTVANNISGSGSLNINANAVLLSGNNSYTGTTTVQSGTLVLATVNSLYGNNKAAWTAANIKVAPNATLEVRTGNGAAGTGFTAADIATLTSNLNASSGGFAGGSNFGIDTTNGNFTLSQSLANTAQGTLGLVVDGNHTLNVTGANTYTGQTLVRNPATLTTVGTSLANTSVNVASGGTFDLLGQNVTVGSLQGGAGLVTDTGVNATLTVGTDNTNQNFSGAINNGNYPGGGVLSITKVGTGNQNITGPNSYSGVTTISCGSLGGNFGNTSLINNSANLTFTQSNTTVFGYNYTGNGNIIQNGTGTTILSGNVNLLGKILVQCGTLDFATKSALFGGNTSQWNANSILVSNGATLAVMPGNGSYGTGFTTSDITTLLTNLNSTSGGFASGALFGVDTSNGNYTLPVTLGNTQQGPLGLAALGNHSLILNSSNTYTGQTKVMNGATLDVQSNTAVANSTLVNVTSGGTLRVNATGVNISKAYLAGTGTIDLYGNNLSIGSISDGTYTNYLGVFSQGGYITNSDPVTGMLTVGSSNTDSDFSGVIQDGAGKVALTKVGTGTFNIYLNKTFSGGTTIACGTIGLGAGSAAYSGIGNLGSGTITMLGGSLTAWQADNYYGIGAGVTLNNSVVVSSSGSVTGYVPITFNGPVSLANGATLTTGGLVNFGQNSSSPGISGGGNLAVASGTTYLNGANSYTGTTTIASGSTLQVNGGNGPGVSSQITDNGALVLNAPGNFSTSSDIVGSGSMTKNGAGTVTLTGNVGFSGATTINAGTLQVGNGTAGSWIGNGSITDNGSLVFDVPGNLALAGISGTGSLNATVTNGTLNFTQPVNLTGAGSTITGNAAKGMTVSANLSAPGGIDLSTQQGNLTVGGNLTSSSGNVTLAAGQAGPLGLPSGTDTSGDVILSKPGAVTASVGQGKTVAIYSGNANSANLQTLVQSGTIYNKAFDANASTTNPNANFGINLIYRTVPALPVAGATAQDRVYNGCTTVNVTLNPGSHTTVFDGDTYTFNFNNGVDVGHASSSHVGCWTVVANPVPATVTPAVLGACVSGAGNVTFSNITVNITPAPLTAMAVNETKVYGTSDPSLGTANVSYTVSGLQGNDTASNVMSGSLGRKAGENVGTYNITAGNLASNSDYTLTINLAGARETITPANLTVTASNDTKTYGTNDPTLAYTTTGLVNGTVQSRDANGNLVNVTLADTAANTLTGSLGRQSGEGVGNYAITNGSLASNGNYALTIDTTGANETITPANLTVTAQNETKVYGTNDPTLAYTTTGLVSGTVQSRDANGNLVNVTLADTAANTLTGSLGRQSGEGVGSYAITNGSLASNGNYALTIDTTGANETITPANLAVTAQNETKVYGTNDPTLVYTTTGLVSGTVQSRDANGNLVNVTLADTAANTLTGSLGRQSGEGVGSYAITHGSLASNGNYALTIDTTGANETITPANLAVTASNDTKTYGTNDPTLAYTTAGLVSGTVQSRDANGNLVNVTLADTAANTLTGSLGRQSGEGVGNYAITHGSLASNGNYALTIDTTGANETITPANLAVTAQNETKVYGTNDPTLVYTTTGLVSGTVQSRDANGNLVNVTLADTAANTLTGSLGRQSGEGVGSYAITHGSLASNGNYALTIDTTGANETITPANLAVTAQNETKVYGTNDPTLAYTTAGLVNGTVQSRDANGNLVNVTLADTAANTLTGSLGRQSGEGVGSYAITHGSLASNGNYALTIDTTGANETITPANLAVTASNDTKTYGTNDPTLAYTTAGLVSGTVQSRDANGNLVNVTLADTAANTLTGSLGRQSGEGVGSYAITHGSLASNGNYALTIDTTGANETITPANLAVTAQNETKVYGTNDPTLVYTTTGLVSGTVQSRDANGNLVNVTLADTAANTLTGSLGRQSGEGVGSYAITHGSLASNGNYALTIDTTGANETITPANLTVTAQNETKVYGTNDPTLAYTTTGLVSGTVQSRDANGNLVNVTLADTAANTLTGSLGRMAGENVGSYAITAGNLALSSQAANYRIKIDTDEAALTITPLETIASLPDSAKNVTANPGQFSEFVCFPDRDGQAKDMSEAALDNSVTGAVERRFACMEQWRRPVGQVATIDTGARLLRQE